MDFRIEKIGRDDFPPQLLEIPEPPQGLYALGAPLPKDGLYLSVVGARNNTSYGRDACEKLIAGLAGTDIYIVSGLALGTDTAAHKAALKAGLKTIAFPGSGLSEKVLYPASNLSLAKEILAGGGTLISEYEPSFKATQWSFPKRNRLMAGIARAVLIEAADKSGTQITARLALDYNREVMAVPGPITSTASFGTNRLIKEGAMLVTSSDDILEFFGYETAKEDSQKELPLEDLSDDEKQILELLQEPLSRDELIDSLDGDASEINILLSTLEIKGIIKEEFGEIRRV